MKAKIFLGEYAYMYRGNIDLREINEYIKSITRRPYILKWKDNDDDFISVLKKRDLQHFYNKWQQNNKNQIFKLYIYELFNQTGHGPENSETQIQINSPVQSNQYLRKQNLAFTFGPGHDFQNTNVQRSQELPRDSHRISQGRKLESIAEQKDESQRNLSDKNLDQQNSFNFFKQRHQSIKIADPSLIVENHEEEEVYVQPASPSSRDPQEMKESITKRAINREQYRDIPFIEDISDDQSNDDSVNDIYCDYCSEKITSIQEKTEYYHCAYCSDVHICKLCYDNNQEYCHDHQLNKF